MERNQVYQLFVELYSGKEAAGVSAGSYMAQLTSLILKITNDKA